jgi:hypothetical protein
VLESRAVLYVCVFSCLFFELKMQESSAGNPRVPAGQGTVPEQHFVLGLSAPLEFVLVVVLTNEGESHADDAFVGVWYRFRGLKLRENRQIDWKGHEIRIYTCRGSCLRH